jgi:predicted phage terminase large subunit-like protein
VADIKRRPLDEMIKDMVAYQMRFQCEEFGYEVNQFQRAVVQQIEDEARKRGIRMPLKEITNTKDKVRRIQSLDRPVRNGTIQFNQEHRLLLEQMRDFPQGRFDDGLDALEMAVRIAGNTNTVDPEKLIQLLQKVNDQRANKNPKRIITVNGKPFDDPFGLFG